MVSNSRPRSRHQLHADANAEKRAAAGDDRLGERGFETGHRGEPAPTVGKGAHARQHDAVGAGDGFGLARDFDVGCNRVLRGGALERLGGRAQIAEP